MALRAAAGRGLHAVRRSMTAQISLAIALVSVLIILFFGTMLDQFLARELREENELLLLSTLAFLRDDLAAAGNDVAAVPRIVDTARRRTRHLELAVVDEQRGTVIAMSPGNPIPVGFALPVLDSQLLPARFDFAQADAVRQQLPDDLTSVWQAPDGRRYRVLRGRIAIPAAQGVQPGSLLVTLAAETAVRGEVRLRNREVLQASLVVAAVLASLFGIWIARRIVVSARRLGAAASRIGADDLHQRLSLEDTPTELLESTLAFNHMLDRLQDAFERLSAFSSDLAHDLRTPIGNLLGEAQVALSRPRTADDYRAVLESAVEEYERLSRIIGNMLFLARAENQGAVEGRWIALDSTLERLTGYFDLLADERGVVLATEIVAPSHAQRRVWADETTLVRALSNLVSNALQFAPRGTAILLSAQVAPGGSCQVSVANQGPSIPAGQQARIFERFYRVDPSREGSASGSGLGLAIVRSIMDMHRGSVSVDSAPGRPTVFTLHFPPGPGSSETAGDGAARASPAA